ncbi:peptide ABC transporter substrate-binding protein [Seohaeicola nanhaiensis]|uniref:Peptide ABC transporter substrate-binding protein n=1 Tax=Seohaeicola nanhaiensis TaxID=1387282 RepID=A0ABV9KGJ0_9RHOB
MTRLDRRALFTSGAAAALLAASGLSADARPRAGGTLKLAVPRDGSLARVAEGAAFDQLTEIAPDGTLRGELALSWRGSEDARRFSFRLRRDARFHDGTVFAARHATEMLGAVPGVRAVHLESAFDLTVELSAANFQLPLDLADPAHAIRRDGMGTGAYRIARMDEARHLLALRVEDHYKAGAAGWADRIEVIVIPDARVRAEALRGGYVDLAYLPEASGLIGQGEFRYHPSADDIAIAARAGVGIPRQIGNRAPLDDGRIAERWWVA